MNNDNDNPIAAVRNICILFKRAVLKLVGIRERISKERPESTELHFYILFTNITLLSIVNRSDCADIHDYMFK